LGKSGIRASGWDGTQFDGVMNYLFAAPTIAFTAGDRVYGACKTALSSLPAFVCSRVCRKIQELLQLYPWEIQSTQLNLLASDTARLISIAMAIAPVLS